MTITGAFDTGRFDLVPRTIFWLLLLMSVAAIWVAVPYRWLSERPGWQVVVPLAIVATAVLVPLLGRTYGYLLFGTTLVSGSVSDGARIAGQALLIGAVVWMSVMLVLRLARPAETAIERPRQGPLFRARIEPQSLRRIEAQDHYVLLVDADGKERLLHGRFADFVADAASIDGLEVRRGTWVAAADVAQVVRTGRRWVVTCRDGGTVVASEAGGRRMRDAGWV